jgi:hypothetical protein
MLSYYIDKSSGTQCIFTIYIMICTLKLRQITPSSLILDVAHSQSAET